MKRNGGFSLVELMVAMVIGLVIILGAGQLFLTVFQTQRQVEALGEKQAAVNFAVETLIRDIRRAAQDTIEWNDTDREFKLTVRNRGDVVSGCSPGDEVDKTYRLSGSELQVRNDCGGGGDFQSVVSGLDAGGPNNGFNINLDASDVGKGIWMVQIDLIATDFSGDADSLSFYAVNRTSAVENSGVDDTDSDSGDEAEESDPDGDGYDDNGNQLYADECYNGGGKFKPRWCGM
ncbi:PilW family protein [Halomonas salina]|uniref:PilW family protein n=1 Tax=Halomonas salina TaxID=42565 RepID=UPI0009E04219|nr:prepilin-type N-terminal cleavage/methylation domain-containing protein [Halomonas salina]